MGLAALWVAAAAAQAAWIAVAPAAASEGRRTVTADQVSGTTVTSWYSAATSVSGVLQGPPRGCVVETGPTSLRNGWLVTVTAGDLCCVERGTLEADNNCYVGCQSTVRFPLEYVSASAQTGADCYSQCYDTVGSTTLSTFPVMGVQATYSFKEVYVAIPPTRKKNVAGQVPSNLYMVADIADSNTLFPAYGLTTLFFNNAPDVLCASRGKLVDPTTCVSSCNVPVADFVYTTTDPGACFYDCYIPTDVCSAGPCNAHDASVYTFSTQLDAASCHISVANSADLCTYQFGVAGAWLPSSDAPPYKPTQPTCVLNIGIDQAPIVTATCTQCTDICNQLNTWQGFIDCTVDSCA